MTNTQLLIHGVATILQLVTLMLSVSTNDVVATNQGISLFGFYNITKYTATLKAWSSDCIAAMQQ